MSFMELLKRVLRDEHPLPENLRSEHRRHVEVLTNARQAAESLDSGDTSIINSRAIKELRTLEEVARRR